MVPICWLKIHIYFLNRNRKAKEVFSIVDFEILIQLQSIEVMDQIQKESFLGKKESKCKYNKKIQ